jgi:hypothetical protein
MPADRYLKCVLTVIALELLWLGVRQAPPALAQQKPEPMAVVITGVRIGTQNYTTIPVAVVGSVRPQSVPASRELPNIQPLSVNVPDPVQIDSRQPLAVQIANQPLTIQSGTKPLVVDVLPAKPGLRPGL